jgi:hypothetical protein
MTLTHLEYELGCGNEGNSHWATTAGMQCTSGHGSILTMLQDLSCSNRGSDLDVLNL